MIQYGINDILHASSYSPHIHTRFFLPFRLQHNVFMIGANEHAIYPPALCGCGLMLAIYGTWKAISYYRRGFYANNFAIFTRTT